MTYQYHGRPDPTVPDAVYRNRKLRNGMIWAHRVVWATALAVILAAMVSTFSGLDSNTASRTPNLPMSTTAQNSSG